MSLNSGMSHTLSSQDNASLSKSLSVANKRSEPNQVGNPPGSLRTETHVKQCQDLSELEERITCEICTMKMWSPFTYVHCALPFPINHLILL